jgi:hypothetical protein
MRWIKLALVLVAAVLACLGIHAPCIVTVGYKPARMARFARKRLALPAKQSDSTVTRSKQTKPRQPKHKEPP